MMVVNHSACNKFPKTSAIAISAFLPSPEKTRVVLCNTSSHWSYRFKIQIKII